jgi:hypothetical protein
MGYTHYWTFNKPQGVKVADLEARYQQAVRECQRICYEYNKGLPKGDPARLSGFAGHTKPGTYGGLEVNGSGDNAHETFLLPENFTRAWDSRRLGGFCKTARKPYDTVVTACLAILKYRLKDAIEVGSDGRVGDWVAGTVLAQLVIRRKVKNPIQPKRAPRDNGLYLVA